MKYYLYIKTSPMGLKYLGKTTKNPFIYNGSGKIWKRHLLKHKLTFNDIITEIIFETDDETELIKKGIEYSNKFNVVESDEWANLRKESGDGGNTSKFIDYNSENFHNSNRSKHLNTFSNDDEKKKIIAERTSRIDYNNPNRLKKIKENTDWKSWKESIKNRKLDYSKMNRNVVNKKPILQLDLNDNIVSEFDSISKASKFLKCEISGIRHCLKGRNKTAYGYKWKYKIY